MNQQPETEQRVSIWSVPKDWQVWYLVIFDFQVLFLMGLISWHEMASAPVADGPVDILKAIGTSMAPLIVLVAAESIFLTDVSKMLFTVISEKYLKRRRAEGHAEGLAEGHAKERQKWEGWNERRLAAEAAGEEFTEPPPLPFNSNGSE